MNKLPFGLLLVVAMLVCPTRGLASDTYTPFLFQDYPGPKASHMVYLRDAISFDAPPARPAPRSKHP